MHRDDLGPVRDRVELGEAASPGQADPRPQHRAALDGGLREDGMGRRAQPRGTGHRALVGVLTHEDAAVGRYAGARDRPVEDPAFGLGPPVQQGRLGELPREGRVERRPRALPRGVPGSRVGDDAPADPGEGGQHLDDPGAGPEGQGAVVLEADVGERRPDVEEEYGHLGAFREITV
ncbi:hypothetical protein ACFQFR_32820 [Streptomyces goshikiensis]